MPSYSALSPRQREQELLILNDRYQGYQKQNLKLNMTRGKPCPEQLDLSAGLMTCLSEHDYKASDGTDIRNYGGIGGLPEARRLFADILGTTIEHVTVSGNSSLNLMYDTLVKALLFPLPGTELPWSKQGQLKFICPTPGYDRHFFVTQNLGFELIPVPG